MQQLGLSHCLQRLLSDFYRTSGMLALSLMLSAAPVAHAAETLSVRNEHDGACDDTNPAQAVPCRSFSGLSGLGATGLGLTGLGLAGLAALLSSGKGGGKDSGSKHGDLSLPADSTATALPAAPGIRPPVNGMPGDEATVSRLRGQRDLQGQTLEVTPPGMLNTGLLHNGMLRVSGGGTATPATFYNQGRAENVAVSLADGGRLHNLAGAWLSLGTRSDSDYSHGASLHNHGMLALERPLIGGGELVNQRDGQLALHGQGSVRFQENASFINHGTVTASRAATGNDSLAIYMNGWSYGTGQAVSTGTLHASGGYGILNTLSAISHGSRGTAGQPPDRRRDLFVNRGKIEFKAENGSRHAFFIRQGHAGHDLLNAAGSILTVTGNHAVAMRSDSDSQLINRGILNLGTPGTRDIGMTGMMLGKEATGIILNDAEGLIHIHARQSHAFNMGSEHGQLLNRGQVLLHCGDHSCSSYDTEATRGRDALGTPADRDFHYHPQVALALGLPEQKLPTGNGSEAAVTPPQRPISLIRAAELAIPEQGALTNTGQIDDAVLMVRGPLHNAPSGRISLTARDSSHFHHTMRNHGTLHVGTTLVGADTGRLINDRDGVITLDGKGTIRVTAQSLFVNNGTVAADHAGSDNAERFILTQSSAGGGPARPAINTGTITARGGYGVATLEASDYQKRVFINRGQIHFTAENGATRALHVPAFNNFNELVNDRNGILTVYGNNAVAMGTNGMATRLINRGTINLGVKGTADSGMVAMDVGAWGLPDGRQPAVIMRSTILNDSSGIINIFARRSFAFRVHQPAGNFPPAAVLLNRGKIYLQCGNESCQHTEQAISTSDQLTRAYRYELPDVSGSDAPDPAVPSPDTPPRSGHHLLLGGFAGGLFVNTGRIDQLHLDTLGDVHNTGTGVLTLDDTQHGQIRNALWNDGLINIGTRLATLDGGRFVNKPGGQLRLTGNGSLFASSDSAFINRGRILAEHATAGSETPPALLVMNGSGHNNGSLTKFNTGDLIARGGYEAVRAEAGNKRQMFANHGTIDFTAEQGASRALSVTSPASNDHDLTTDLVNDHGGVITVRGDNAVAMSSDTHSQLINRGTINLGEPGSRHVGLVAMEQRRWRGPRPRSGPSLLINEHGGVIHVNTRQSYAFRSGAGDAQLINRGRIFLGCGNDSCRYFADDDTAGADITQTPAGLQFSYDASVPAGGTNGYEVDQRGDHGPLYGSNGLPVIPEGAAPRPATTSSSVMREHGNSGAQNLKGQVHVVTGHERLTNTGSFSHGTLQVQPEGILLNRGSLRHAVIDVRGSLQNRQGAHINLSGKYTGSDDAFGVLRTHGLPSSVSGKLNNEGTLTVHTPLNGSGLFSNQPGGVLNLAANGAVHLSGSGSFVNHGRVIAGGTAADNQTARAVLLRDGWHSATSATAPLSDSRNTGSIVAEGGYAVLTTTSAMQAGRSRFSNSGRIEFTATPATRSALSVRHGHHGHDLVNAQHGKITIQGEQAIAMYSDSDSMVVNNGTLKLGEPGTNATGMIAMALGPNAGHGAMLLNDSQGEILVYARQSHAFAIAGNGSLINRGQVKLLCGEQGGCGIYRDTHTEGRRQTDSPPAPDSAQSLAGYVIGTRPDGGAGTLDGGHLDASGVTVDTGFATGSSLRHATFSKVLRGKRIDGIERITSRNAAWRAQAYRDADGDIGITLIKNDYRDLVPDAALHPVAAALERGYDGSALFHSLELGSATDIGHALRQLSGAGIASSLQPLRTLEQRFVRLSDDMSENRAGFGFRLAGSRHGQPEARLGSSTYDLVALRQRFEFGHGARLTARYGLASVKPGAANAGLDGHSQLFGLHYAQPLGHRMQLEGEFRYAQHRIDTRRTLRYGDVNLRPQASQRRDQSSNRLALVLPPLPINGPALAPLFGLMVRHQRDAALTERHAGAYALRLSATHDSTLDGVFGLRFRHDTVDRHNGRGWRIDAEVLARPALYRQADVRQARFASAPAAGRFDLPASGSHRLGYDGRLGLSHHGRDSRFEISAFASRDNGAGDRNIMANYRRSF